MGYINCGVSDNYGRIKTKKHLKEHAVKNPELTYLDSTAMVGDSYNGSLADAPDGNYSVVGPDPYTKRSWYATIAKRGDTIKVS
jgi:hypothetical protein